MIKSKKIARTLEIHRYTLWRNEGDSITNDIAISMGKHGAVDTNPVYDRRTTSGVSPVDTLNDVAEHNLTEIRRAMGEARKWEVRLKDSPLGKTQQDFVAYYTEVVAIFEEWCTAHGVPLPE